MPFTTASDTDPPARPFRSGLLVTLATVLLVAAAFPREAAGQGPLPAEQEAPAVPHPQPTQEPPPSPPPPQQPVDLAELERRVEVLAAELERLRSGEEEVELSEQRRRALGLAPSAATTYRRRQGVSIAGYGEMLYENPAGTNQRGAPTGAGSQLDFLRAIFYAGYRFTDRFVFNSEIELEHTNEISLEFAYVDFLLNPALTIRGGLVLLPLGLVNEYHEPNVFLGARRPEVESRIIPSTWRENGVGVLGSAGRVSYRAYLVNGLNAGGFTADGLRGGRQKGARAKTTDAAFAGRLDVQPIPGLILGGAIYAGGSGQGQFTVDGDTLNVGTTIGQVHGQLQMRGLDLRGLYARAAIEDVARLNRALSLTGARSVGSVLEGGYAQVGYNVLSHWTDRIAITPYYRFEALDTQADVPAGFLSDPARASRIHTLGAELRPIYNVVIKSDYQWFRNEARTGRSQFNIALGYAF